MDYLHGKTTYTVGYMNSEENDYKANTMSLGLSQDMFGDLTTVSFGFKRGINDVFRNVKTPGATSIGDPTFQREAARPRSYSVGVTQVLTRNLLLSR